MTRQRMMVWVPLMLAAIVLGGGIAAFLARAVGPADGTVVLISDRLPGRAPVIDSVLAPGSALRRGDVVLAVDGIPIDGLGRGPRPHRGQVLSYTVQRDGQQVQVSVRLGHWSADRWVRRNWPTGVLALGLLVVAVYVFRHRPEDPAARALLAVSTFVTVGGATYVLGAQVVDLSTGMNLPWLVFGEAALAAMWATWLLFALLFPRPVSAPTVGVLVAGCGCAVLAVYGGYLVLAFGAEGSAGVAQLRAAAVSLGPGFVFPPVILTVVAVRFWQMRGTREGRYLGGLLGAIAVGFGLYCLLWQLPSALGRPPVVSWEMLPLAFAPCPAILGAAVLRYGLFDMKAIAFRSLVYTTLTASGIAGYIGLVAALGTLITRSPVVAPLLATVVLAVVFQPVKDRLQGAVSRLLYGSRDEPYVALSRLGKQLENTAAADTLLPTLAHTVASALRLPYAAAELCSIDGTALQRAAVGAGSDRSVVLPAMAGGHLVGRLVVAPRSPDTGFADSEMRLLTDLVRHAAPALNALRLAAELRRSQQRVVRAAAEERRRVQRDLHDGIGPSLAGLTMKVGAARSGLETGNVHAAAAALAGIEQRLGDCASDVRQLLLRLRSPRLDSLGLIGALRQQSEQLATDGGLKVEVTAPHEMPDIPAAVEEAALAIAAEAITNVVRHAQAERCEVELSIGDALILSIRDDGRGMPTQVVPTGIGMLSMHQRAGELGGTFAARRRPAGGTEVSVSLPIESP